MRRLLIWLLVLCVHTSSYAQMVRPILWGPHGAPRAGFTANGTLLQNGIITPNPHQGLHTLMNISVWTITAFAMSNTTDPAFMQPSLADMASALSLTPEQAASQISTIYIGPNPYANVSPPNANTAANAAAYNQVIADYIALGGNAATTQTQGSLSIFGADGIMNTPVFQAALPGGTGAAGVTLSQTTESVQNTDAVANFNAAQIQNSALLGSPIYYSRTRVDRGSHTSDATCVQRGECVDPAQQWHQTLFGAHNTANNFELGYIQANGQAHAFDLNNNRYFSTWQAQTRSEWENTAQHLNSTLALNLGKATTQHIKGQQAATGINFAAFDEDRGLFMQGIDLYAHVRSPADRATLDALRSGTLRPGDAGYENARALAQRAYSQAWAQHVEFDTRLTHNRESAHYQAQRVQLNTMGSQELFTSGLNLYGKGLSAQQQQMLRDLQDGRLQQGQAAYEQARALAEAQWRAAYEQSLMPPPKKSWFKKLAGVVLGAVAAFFVGPLVAQWIGGLIPGATATATVATTQATIAAGTAGMTTTVVAGTAGTTLTVGGAVASGIGSAVGSATSAFISTSIATGSMSQGFKAAGNALQGGLVSAAVGALVPGLGITSDTGKFAVGTAVRAAAATATGGGSFGQNLLAAGIGQGMQVISANVAHSIGDTFDSGSALNYASHAGWGCVSGAVAARSSSGCASGAVGAAVGDWAGQQVHQNLQSSNPNALLQAFANTQGLDGTATFFAGVAGGAAAAAVGGKDRVEQSFGIGQSTSQNAFENNYLNHLPPNGAALSEKERYENAAQACATGDKAACGTRDELAALSRQRDRALQEACTSDPARCKALAQEAARMGNTVQGTEGGLVWANSPESGPIRGLNTETAGSPGRPTNFHDQLAQSTAEGLLLQGGDLLAGAVLAAAGKGAMAANKAVKDFFAARGVAIGDELAATVTNNIYRDGSVARLDRGGGRLAESGGANGGATVTSGGSANTVSGARLNMQLSAEQAAGTRAPTAITSYSDHAVTQIASRDGGIGVSQAAVSDAFANPVNIQYVPSKYGPTFKYTGQNATVVVNSEGNVVTTWATNSAGTGK